MALVLALEKVGGKDKKLVGGKGEALARLAGEGFPVPTTLCITTEAYLDFIAGNGLAERILLECSRKKFSDMRWEEMWDAALRIRHLFLNQPMPETLKREIGSAIAEIFVDRPVAIRSSAPEEDASAASFAGLHESFIHVKGSEAILDHIKLVWASLWSDAALLYRQELGLDIEKSTMAVLVQEVIHGRSSGILFTRSPDNPEKTVIEAVHGLNQALVDGEIEPDRWFVPREGGSSEFLPAKRNLYMIPAQQGTTLVPLPAALLHRSPLEEKEVRELVAVGLTIEKLNKSPQDIEWTFKDDKLVILQARPVSTADAQGQKDERTWYLSLHRSFENLQELRQKIENTYLPAMEKDAGELAEVNLAVLSDEDLADVIENRHVMSERWTGIYWEEFIPFAHGMRLFGKVYNDSVKPDNPYEFMDLLVTTPLESVKRNTIISDLAEKVRNNKLLEAQLKKGSVSEFVDSEFQQLFDSFIQQYGDMSCAFGLEGHCRADLKTLMAVILETASHSPVERRKSRSDQIKLMENYLYAFPLEKRAQAQELLDLGRASYRLRDDDNIYLGKFEQLEAKGLEAAHQRLARAKRISEGMSLDVQACLKALRDNSYVPKQKTTSGLEQTQAKPSAKARQLVGQPAGPGVAQGRAIVVRTVDDFSRIKKGDVLVCDALDPNMTFVVPLTAAIIERRGGMLIHGAIIAREYGIPCVTGITDATRLIQTGDMVNVDGYLGIVTISGS